MVNKKERKKGGDWFRIPTSDLETRLLEYEAQLKIAGQMEDFDSIATISETCADIMFVLNQRHMGRYIFPATLRALDEFHSFKINGKLVEAISFLDEFIEGKKKEIEFLSNLKETVEKHLNNQGEK